MQQNCKENKNKIKEIGYLKTIKKGQCEIEEFWKYTVFKLGCEYRITYFIIIVV